MHNYDLGASEDSDRPFGEDITHVGGCLTCLRYAAYVWGAAHFPISLAAAGKTCDLGSANRMHWSSSKSSSWCRRSAEQIIVSSAWWWQHWLPHQTSLKAQL